MEVVSNALKILAVEDSADDFDLFAGSLKGHGYELTLERVDTEAAMRQALETKEWNLVVSDYSMPRFSGLQALSVLRELRRDLPFIILSGTIDEATAVEVMRAGAQDYIMKGNLQRLLPAIERELRDYRTKKSLESDLSIKAEQLLHAQKMEAIGNVAGGLAHDFNNLLTVIILNCQDAMETITVNDLACASIDRIELAAEKAAAIARQLLAFTRKQESRAKVIDVSRLVERQVELLERLIGHNVGIKTELSAELPCVKMDPGQLEQVILNLAINARDAMPQGGTLVIGGEETNFPQEVAMDSGILRAGRYLALSARDTGIGMNVATKSRIFEPFFTTKPAGKGTGLGLSTVYGIVTQAGGAIGVDSELGKGTTFKIYLPAVDEIPEPENEVRQPEVAFAASGTILLVEERADLRNVLQAMLARRGYSVIAALTESEGLELLEKNNGKVDLLVAGIGAPATAGDELARKVRAMSPGLPIIFTSMDTDNGIQEKNKVEVLRKPFLFKALLEKIRSLMEP